LTTTLLCGAIRTRKEINRHALSVMWR